MNQNLPYDKRFLAKKSDLESMMHVVDSILWHFGDHLFRSKSFQVSMDVTNIDAKSPWPLFVEAWLCLAKSLTV